MLNGVDVSNPEIDVFLRRNALQDAPPTHTSYGDVNNCYGFLTLESNNNNTRILEPNKITKLKW